MRFQPRPQVKQDISGSQGPWPGFSAALPAASRMKCRALLPFSASFVECGKMRHFQELELRKHQHGWMDGGGGRRFGASTPR